MSNRIPWEFFLVRYVSNVVAGEFLNFGVILRTTAASRRPQAEARFTSRWDQLLRADPHIDIGLLEHFAMEISAQVEVESFSSRHAGHSIVDLMTDTFSNSIQIADPLTSLAESFESEITRIMLLYIDSPLRQ